MRANSKTLACLLAIAVALAIDAALAQQQPSETQILEALKPKPTPPGLTRSIGGASSSPRAAEERRFIERLRTRAISVEPVSPEERAQIAAISKDKPKVDLEIYFDFNSAVVGPKALPALGALGNVLSKAEFKGTVFFINGHTDAKGSAEYNQGLSQLRAEAVRRAMIERFKLAPDTLIAAGFGKEQLKNAGNPFADENRRVQIVNTEQKASASAR
jgi:outer membrane protein OmpA-like peptidoglycan-associated protein